MSSLLYTIKNYNANIISVAAFASNPNYALPGLVLSFPQDRSARLRQKEAKGFLGETETW
jgi:hypothetical protein